MIDYDRKLRIPPSYVFLSWFFVPVIFFFSILEHFAIINQMKISLLNNWVWKANLECSFFVCKPNLKIARKKDRIVGFAYNEVCSFQLAIGFQFLVMGCYNFSLALQSVGWVSGSLVIVDKYFKRVAKPFWFKFSEKKAKKALFIEYEEESSLRWFGLW